MLYQLNVSNGFCQFAGPAKYLKIISATSPVKIEVIANGTRSGRVLLTSQNVRAPMGFELPADAGVVNFYGDDQSLEIWSGDQPLEYMQLTAVGGSAIKTSQVGLTAGTLQKLLDAQPRKKVLVKTTTPVTLKSDPLEQGWPLGESEQIELELTGPLYAQKAASTFISAAAAHALISPENYYIDANTNVVFYRKMANGDRIVQRYRESLTIYLAQGGEISGSGFAAEDINTGAVYALFAPLDSETTAKASIYRHDGNGLSLVLNTADSIKCNKYAMSFGADNALYLIAFLSGNKIVRFDLVTGAITTLSEDADICTSAIDGYVYYIKGQSLCRRATFTAPEEVVIASGLGNTSKPFSAAYGRKMMLRGTGLSAKTIRIIDLLTLNVDSYSEPAATSNRYASFYDGINWFFANGDGRLLRLQNGAAEIVGGAIDNAGAENCAFVGYDAVQQKIVVGVSPADSEIKAASIDVVTLGDSRPAVVSTLETFI